MHVRASRALSIISFVPREPYIPSNGNTNILLRYQGKRQCHACFSAALGPRPTHCPCCSQWSCRFCIPAVWASLLSFFRLICLCVFPHPSCSLVMELSRRLRGRTKNARRTPDGRMTSSGVFLPFFWRCSWARSSLPGPQRFP